MLRDASNPVQKPKTVSQIDREAYEARLAAKKLSPDQQLALFTEFQSDVPEPYTVLYELYDAIPKFSTTALTTDRSKGKLGIVEREFMWGERKLNVTITPIVVKSRNREGQTIEKEILPGPREETIFRVLKKMAADASVEKHARDEVGVVMSFTLSHLRSRLRLVGHEYKISEIREALEVLNRSAIDVTDISRRKRIYSGSHIYLKFALSEVDTENEYGRVEVAFNALATNAINSKTYDRIHYNRLMSLSPLGAWIYELITRKFRQAGIGQGYKLSLSTILAESGMPRHNRIRSNVLQVRKTLAELIKADVLAVYPRYTEEITCDLSSNRGRRPIKEVLWTLFPSEQVIRDIREDNGAKKRRREYSRAISQRD